MILTQSIQEMQNLAGQMRMEGQQIGFVPTMGALHKGHLNLIERARQGNDKVVCSIFVNPIQFNNPDDLKNYPRTFERDIELLKPLGCDVVFHPDAAEMYPQKPDQKYDFGLLDKVMEGRYREGHFNGVAIVVKKLFDIVQPHRAYFGQKDFQQLAVIQALVKQEDIPVDIVPCPTVREEDGLAMSSRNVRLSAEERKNAPLIYQSLHKASQMYTRSAAGVEEIKQWVSETINHNPFMELEYFEISNPDTLAPVQGDKPTTPVVACIAVQVGSVRLIDNILFNS